MGDIEEVKRLGFVKLYRSALHDGTLRHHNMWILWTYCLMKASYTTRELMIGGQMVRLDPGQLIFGRHKAAEETGLSERQIRTSLDGLKKASKVTTRSTNKYSIISIVNWDTYQGSQIENDQQKVRQTTSRTPQIKNEKKIKNYPPTPLQGGVAGGVRETSPWTQCPRCKREILKSDLIDGGCIKCQERGEIPEAVKMIIYGEENG